MWSKFIHSLRSDPEFWMRGITCVEKYHAIEKDRSMVNIQTPLMTNKCRLFFAVMSNNRNSSIIFIHNSFYLVTSTCVPIHLEMKGWRMIVRHSVVIIVYYRISHLIIIISPTEWYTNCNDVHTKWKHNFAVLFTINVYIYIYSSSLCLQ